MSSQSRTEAAGTPPIAAADNKQHQPRAVPANRLTRAAAAAQVLPFAALFYWVD